MPFRICQIEGGKIIGCQTMQFTTSTAMGQKPWAKAAAAAGVCV